MPALNFKALIQIHGVNPYIDITPAQATTLKPNWKKPLPVLICINDQPKPPWKINMMPKGDGSFYLYLHGSVRKASNTKVGDTVDVKIKFDPEYKNGPTHPVPNWFKTELSKNPTTQKNWDNLTPSRQKEILRYLSNLKSEEAIARNLAKVLDILSGHPGRFMARSWKDGA